MPFVVGSFIPVLHSGPFQCLFSSVRPFLVPCSTPSLVEYYLTKFPLRRATPVWRVIFLPAANSFHGPQFAWIRIFLKTFPLRHAILERWDTSLQAAANFLRDPQIQFLWLSTSPSNEL
jgi:hypothetical protein